MYISVIYCYNFTVKTVFVIKKFFLAGYSVIRPAGYPANETDNRPDTGFPVQP